MIFFFKLGVLIVFVIYGDKELGTKILKQEIICLFQFLHWVKVGIIGIMNIQKIGEDRRMNGGC